MINYRLNKLKILSFINRTIYKKRYILDNSKVIDLKKISKGDFNYDIVMIDKENNKESFRVFINIIFRKKIIYIESFARCNKPSLTGKIMYKFADIFIVQWEEMLEFFPKAMYGGGIF